MFTNIVKLEKNEKHKNVMHINLSFVSEKQGQALWMTKYSFYFVRARKEQMRVGFIICMYHIGLKLNIDVNIYFEYE